MSAPGDEGHGDELTGADPDGCRARRGAPRSGEPALREALVVAAAARRRHSRRRRRGVVLKSAAGVLLLLAAAIVVLIATGATTAEHLITNCSLAGRQARTPGASSFVEASDGTSVGTFPSPRNREPIPLDEMGPWLPKATVAIEDRRFWEHGALDFTGIIRAAIANIQAGRPVQGGSTLQVQLVRNMYLRPDADRTLSVKIEEACLANRLSQRWSRQRILGTYLNIVYYGHHAYGVEAAARTYFARPASELTLSQAAVIAGLPQAPTLYDPFEHPSMALARRDDVLEAMAATGAISERQYARAVAHQLGLRHGDRFRALPDSAFSSYLEQELVGRFGPHAARAGGLQVTSTLSRRMQRIAVDAIREHLAAPTDPAAALVAIDPRTGAVRAMAALSPGQRMDFNLATQAHRQAGSAFKPFTLVTALEQHVSPESVWQGPPELEIGNKRCLNGTEPWDVHNYGDESAGTMTLADATAHSVNTIFAQLVAAVGPEQVVATAHRMGIRSALSPVCSITLGALAVSPLEMTNAYATLAARGMYRPASPIRSVRLSSGRVVGGLDLAGRRTIPRNVADMATSVLQGVLQKGTGTAAYFGRPAAGKTGTAEGYVDAWFCGYVPQLATCVWVGYPRAELPLEGIGGFAVLFGGSIPALIWHDFMEAALAKAPVRDFATPDPSPFDQHPEGSFVSVPEPAATTTTETTTQAQPKNQPAPPPAPVTEPETPTSPATTQPATGPSG